MFKKVERLILIHNFEKARRAWMLLAEYPCRTKSWKKNMIFFSACKKCNGRRICLLLKLMIKYDIMWTIHVSIFFTREMTKNFLPKNIPMLKISREQKNDGFCAVFRVKTWKMAKKFVLSKDAQMLKTSRKPENDGSWVGFRVKIGKMEKNSFHEQMLWYPR